MKRTPFVLGIESSCDETCAAVAAGPQDILSHVVATSLDRHAAYGGVIPEIASRAHLESVVPVVEEALRRARVRPQRLAAVAVTETPGLIGSLLVGTSFARALAMAWGKPLIVVDHIRAHLYAAFLENPLRFPFVGLVVSGGHTTLTRVTALGREKVLGATRDDAAGEAFDKVAKILGLGYPGGPAIERAARTGRASAFPFRCACDGSDFSFSGIKTAVLYKVRELTRTGQRLDTATVADVCAAFQDAVVRDLVGKAVAAARRHKARVLAVGGGVAFNGYLRDRLREAAAAAGIAVFLAPREACVDNAIMVASLGCRMRAASGRKARGRKPFDDRG
ncbi:MAG: tRNA (adenosine(37)-N6)-threonylcarbamoyltransferase complex transferase subunit TsaD [Deltaproteobacteria bacterium]